MFDYIKYSAPCWKCKTTLSNFQSKDGECLMDILTPKQLGQGYFNASCPKCDAWNEYDVVCKKAEIIFNEKESKLQTSDEDNQSKETI